MIFKCGAPPSDHHSISSSKIHQILETGQNSRILEVPRKLNDNYVTQLRYYLITRTRGKTGHIPTSC